VVGVRHGLGKWGAGGVMIFLKSVGEVGKRVIRLREDLCFGRVDIFKFSKFLIDTTTEQVRFIEVSGAEAPWAQLRSGV